jgi:hypothetical protein
MLPVCDLDIVTISALVPVAAVGVSPCTRCFPPLISGTTPHTVFAEKTSSITPAMGRPSRVTHTIVVTYCSRSSVNSCHAHNKSALSLVLSAHCACQMRTLVASSGSTVTSMEAKSSMGSICNSDAIFSPVSFVLMFCTRSHVSLCIYSCGTHRGIWIRLLAQDINVWEARTKAIYIHAVCIERSVHIAKHRCTRARIHNIDVYVCAYEFDFSSATVTGSSTPSAVCPLMCAFSDDGPERY